MPLSQFVFQLNANFDSLQALLQGLVAAETTQAGSLVDSSFIATEHTVHLVSDRCIMA